MDLLGFSQKFVVLVSLLCCSKEKTQRQVEDGGGWGAALSPPCWRLEVGDQGAPPRGGGQVLLRTPLGCTQLPCTVACPMVEMGEEALGSLLYKGTNPILKTQLLPPHPLPGPASSYHHSGGELGWRKCRRSIHHTV